MKTILVLGSLNIDFIQHVFRMPLPGETLAGDDLRTCAGGKGANQACAAALLGGRSRMAGKVGTDPFGVRLVQELSDFGVDVEFVHKSTLPSGSALIFVLPSGENAIVISPAANREVSREFALQVVDSLQPGDFLLCQLEIPADSVTVAMEAAYRKGVTTILDPAPAIRLPAELLSSTTILTPNQSETAILLGNDRPPGDFLEASAAAIDLQSLGAKTVIIKMGMVGCFVADARQSFAIEAFRVPVVDTTAAGDTFNGALAAELARGAGIREAVRFANASAAPSVMKPGALASIPSISQVRELLSSQAA